MPGMVETRRFTKLAWLVMLGWAVLLGLWAVQPLTDQVPTGKVDGAGTSVTVECARPIDADPGPDQPLPDVQPPRKYERQACVEQHSDNRVMLFVNVVLIAVIAVGLIVVPRRLNRRAATGPTGQTPAPADP
jgi:hypothetical protein